MSKDTPFKLCLVTETFAPEVNGVAMTLSRLTSGLRKRGHEVSVVRPRMPKDYPHGCEGDEEVRIQLRPGRPIPNYPLMRLGVPSKAVLRALWRRNRPDVVHVATEGPMGVSALLAARSLGIPCTSSFHTNFDDYTADYGAAFLKKPVQQWLKWVHNLARCTMVPTGKQAMDLQVQGYRGVKILSRGVDMDLFKPERRCQVLREKWGASDDTLVLTQVGRLAAEKNLDLAIATMQAIRAKRPNTMLVLVGAGPESTRLSAVDGVHLAGNQCAEDLASHYASADLFVFPSTSETYGNVVPEALASGLPCVAYDYAAPAELFGGRGYPGLVPFNDERSFITAAVDLAENEAERYRLSAEAPSLVSERSWKRVIGDFERFVHEAKSSTLHCT